MLFILTYIDGLFHRADPMNDSQVVTSATAGADHDACMQSPGKCRCQRPPHTPSVWCLTWGAAQRSGPLQPPASQPGFHMSTKREGKGRYMTGGVTNHSHDMVMESKCMAQHLTAHEQLKLCDNKMLPIGASDVERSSYAKCIPS